MIISQETSDYFIQNFEFNFSRYKTGDQLLHTLRINTINASSDGRVYHQVENFECKLKKSKEIKITSLNGSETICNSWTQLSVRFRRGSNIRFEPKQKKRFFGLLKEL